MRTSWIILSIIAVVIVIGAAVFLLMPKSSGPSSTNTGTGFPVASSTGTGSTGTGTAPPAQTMTVAMRGGGPAITVSDFIDNGTTLADPQNKGNYYLAGGPGYCLADGSCPTGAPASDFIVTYDSTRQFFTIALTKEPLGESRHDAEQFMLSTLGVSESDLCNINYYLSTTSYVNSTYAGTNLGFSFCPGATTFPQ